MSVALLNVERSYKVVSATLGAKPVTTFRKVTLPFIAPSVLSESMLAFAHSIGETGATFMVMGDNTTISVLVVNMVEALAIPASLAASALVVAISFVILVAARRIGA